MKDSIEERLTQIAGSMQYPQTPSLIRPVLGRMQGSSSTRSRMRKMAFASAVILVLLSTLMLVPPVRAAILEYGRKNLIRDADRSNSSVKRTCDKNAWRAG